MERQISLAVYVCIGMHVCTYILVFHPLHFTSSILRCPVTYQPYAVRRIHMKTPRNMQQLVAF